MFSIIVFTIQRSQDEASLNVWKHDQGDEAVRTDPVPHSNMDDLEELIDGLRRRMGRLIQEVRRLREENERLKEENKSLREEVTLVRIYKSMENREEEFPTPRPDQIDPEAHELYRQLPEDFRFAEFFEIADEKGVRGDEARLFLLYFIRQGMLAQKGGRVEKPDDNNATQSNAPQPQT